MRVHLTHHYQMKHTQTIAKLLGLLVLANISYAAHWPDPGSKTQLAQSASMTEGGATSGDCSAFGQRLRDGQKLLINSKIQSPFPYTGASFKTFQQSINSQDPCFVAETKKFIYEVIPASTTCDETLNELWKYKSFLFSQYNFEVKDPNYPSVLQLQDHVFSQVKTKPGCYLDIIEQISHDAQNLLTETDDSIIILPDWVGHFSDCSKDGKTLSTCITETIQQSGGGANFANSLNQQTLPNWPTLPDCLGDSSKLSDGLNHLIDLTKNNLFSFLSDPKELGLEAELVTHTGFTSCHSSILSAMITHLKNRQKVYCWRFEIFDRIVTKIQEEYNQDTFERETKSFVTNVEQFIRKQDRFRIGSCYFLKDFFAGTFLGSLETRSRCYRKNLAEVEKEFGDFVKDNSNSPILSEDFISKKVADSSCSFQEISEIIQKTKVKFNLECENKKQAYIDALKPIFKTYHSSDPQLKFQIGSLFFKNFECYFQRDAIEKEAKEAEPEDPCPDTKKTTYKDSYRTCFQSFVETQDSTTLATRLAMTLQGRIKEFKVARQKSLIVS